MMTQLQKHMMTAEDILYPQHACCWYDINNKQTPFLNSVSYAWAYLIADISNEWLIQHPHRIKMILSVTYQALLPLYSLFQIASHYKTVLDLSD